MAFENYPIGQSDIRPDMHNQPGFSCGLNVKTPLTLRYCMSGRCPTGPSNPGRYLVALKNFCPSIKTLVPKPPPVALYPSFWAAIQEYRDVFPRVLVLEPCYCVDEICRVLGISYRKVYGT